MQRKIYIIDGYNFLYRVFYAIPPFTLKDGTPINAVFWMAKILLSFYEQDKPDELIFVMDSKGKNFRQNIYAEYKATRERMPDSLKAQESLMMELLSVLKINPISKEGYEADDVIGTLATTLRKNPENDIYILSGDKDLYQFVGENVAVYDTMKHIVARKKETIDKFGVSPEHVVDYLSICGDTSDNIPGIPGFGPKKAQSLIEQFGSLESIYENLDKISPKLAEALEANREVAFLSKKLAEINVQVDLSEFNFEDCAFKTKEFFTPEVVELFKRFEFKSLLWDGHKVVKNFESLKLTKVNLDEAGLKKLFSDIQKTKQVAISTSGNAVRLELVTFYHWGEEIFVLDPSVVSSKQFLRDLLDSEIEIVSFEYKEDLKKIWRHLDDASVMDDRVQGSLF